MDGLHSPFGNIGQIKEKYGYTHDYILWGVSWNILIMEIADAPRHVKGRRPAPVVESAEDLKKYAGGRFKIIE